MAQIKRESKAAVRSKTEMPAWLSEAAVLLDSLDANGTLGELARRCEIRREGGYAGIDIALFLLAYFATNAGTGLKRFYADALPWWRHLAALAGRVRLPSPPAMSRALGSADSVLLRPFSRWLLTEALDIRPILRHPATQLRDATGKVWLHFHFDPTVDALRQRSLPRREGMPHAVRRASDLALPGRSGRKRGDVVFNRSVLQHAGTGLWLEMRVAPGNGDARDQLGSALDAVVHVCALVEHPAELAVTCTDGEWGGIPSIAAFRERRTRFLTRCSRYNLLEDIAVRRALQSALWRLVPDSGSGPQRGCADAGWVWLEPGQGTRRADGSAYSAERVRLIVSRYPQREGVQKARRGSMIDNVVYELFVTDLDEEGWPAEQACALYFGRCGQENRFAQEDRELELDRIYAYDPAGQELAAAVGAFVWNWRILAGFISNPPEAHEVPQQSPAKSDIDQRKFPPLAVDDGLAAQICEPLVEADADEADEASPPERPMDAARRDAFRNQARQLIQKHLPDLFQSSHLEKKGWSMDRTRGVLICPNQEVFKWYRATNNAKGTSPQIAFRTSHVGTCAACPFKATCRRDPESKKNYQPTLTVPPAIHARLTTPTDLLPRSPSPRPRPPPFLIPASLARGPLEISPACLLPAEARKAARALASAVRFDVDVPRLTPRRRTNPLVAPDARRRRHGRCSHAENIGRYALSANAEVHVRRTALAKPLAFIAALEAMSGAPRRSGVDIPS